MRSKNSKSIFSDRRLLFAALGLVLLFLITANCGLNSEGLFIGASAGNEPGVERAGSSVPGDNSLPDDQDQRLSDQVYNMSDELWADAIEGGAPGGAVTPSSTGTVSIDVRDANIIDVLSMLAYRMDVNILFLGGPDTITFKSENLSPLTTFQLVLQSYVPTQNVQTVQNDLDYLVLGRNYIVGNRERLHSDFFNRMLLTRFGLFYVSAEAMQSYIEDLEIPIQSLTVDANQQALWMQGTPVTLGKAREVINALDVMENAAFAEGGSRKIRMPVATAAGPRAEEELEALIDLLSILLDGFRDGRTEMGWVTWDHPDPIPYIIMDWDNPIIKPYDIKMKITRDFAGDYSNQIRYLIAEGTAANIDLVNQMIQAIAGTPNSPLSFEQYESVPEENDNNNGGTVQYVPENRQQTVTYSNTYTVSLNAVPPEGGSLSGSGTYNEGSAVTISAKPGDGYEFVRWIDGGSQLSTSRSTTFYIYSNRTIEAVFIKTSENDTDAETDEEADEEELE